MLSKKEIKDIQSLGLKKYRDETRLFVAEGPKIVSELIQVMPEQAERVYAVDSWAKENKTLLSDLGLMEVSEAELGRISQLQTPNKVVAVFKQFESMEPVLSSFSLYLDAIQDPGNFGTIIRIADWFGVQHVICSPGCADLYNPKVVQSTMASIARVNVFYDEDDKWLNKQDVPMYAATLQGKPLYAFQKVKEGILLIGNESKGLRKELMEKAGERITIPRKGAAESLNAAVATGIILSHLVG
jgi:TrmH family RNA methyltransferase